MNSPYEVICSTCGRIMDERYVVVWQRVEGWEKKRDQGGTNHVALRRPKNDFMCQECMDKELAGLSAYQLAFG